MKKKKKRQTRQSKPGQRERDRLMDSKRQKWTFEKKKVYNMFMGLHVLESINVLMMPQYSTTIYKKGKFYRFEPNDAW